MKNVFVDTNILIDLLSDRPPFSKFAIEIFDMATAHYVLKKYTDDKRLRDILYTLLDYISVISIDLDIIKKSLLSSHKDFEDAIQIFAAHSIKNLDFIVTRNVKNFKKAEIAVLPPDELLHHLSHFTG